MRAPASVITRLSNRHTAQVCADAQHDKPLGVLYTGAVRLWVTERLPVFAVSLLDLGSGTMPDEDGLAAPFDDNILSFRNAAQLNLDFGKSENIGGGGHGDKEFRHAGLGHRRGENTKGADHEVRERAVLVGVGGTVV